MSRPTRWPWCMPDFAKTISPCSTWNEPTMCTTCIFPFSHVTPSGTFFVRNRDLLMSSAGVPSRNQHLWVHWVPNPSEPSPRLATNELLAQLAYAAEPENLAGGKDQVDADTK